MKKFIIGIIIGIIAITLGVFVGYKLETKNKNSVDLKEGKNTVVKNSNNTVTNNDNTINNMIDTNEIVNEIEQEPEEEIPKTDLEKALDIVKADWGEDETVYFAEDGKTQNGEYSICVRNKNTTKALAWYTVNIETGVFVRE